MAHQTVKDVYGPGTFTDTDFIPVPTDARRILEHLANVTPGFLPGAQAIKEVDFQGDDLPMLPGPIKAQVLVSGYVQ